MKGKSTYLSVRVVAVLVRFALVLGHVFQRETAYSQRLQDIENLRHMPNNSHSYVVGRARIHVLLGTYTSDSHLLLFFPAIFELEISSSPEM